MERLLFCQSSKQYQRENYTLVIMRDLTDLTDFSDGFLNWFLDLNLIELLFILPIRLFNAFLKFLPHKLYRRKLIEKFM